LNQDERRILEALDAAVRSVATAIERIAASVESKLQASPSEVLAWEPVPLETYGTQLPDPVRSSWVFVLRANVATGAERHPNSHQRMMSFRGRGDFPTQPAGEWHSQPLTSDPSAPLERRWVSIPPNVWHQGIVGPEDWVVVSFHTVPPDELIEERPAAEPTGQPRRRRYLGGA
jgi:hypothetical protein